MIIYFYLSLVIFSCKCRMSRFDLDLKTGFNGNFYRAMLASAVLAMALCPSVCLSVRHKSVFY